MNAKALFLRLQDVITVAQHGNILKRDHWERFRDFFGITFIKLIAAWFLLVPILMGNFGVPGGVVSLELQLPWHWKVLWVASLFFAVAFLLYHLFCPHFIKRWPTYGVYQGEGHTKRWMAWHLMNAENEDKTAITAIIEKLEKRKIAVRVPAIPPDLDVPQRLNSTADKESFYFQSQTRLVCIEVPVFGERAEVIQSELFWELFGIYTKSRPPIRRLISICLTVFWGLVAFVIVVKIFAVFFNPAFWQWQS